MIKAQNFSKKFTRARLNLHLLQLLLIPPIPVIVPESLQLEHFLSSFLHC